MRQQCIDILRQFSFSSPLAICWPLLAPQCIEYFAPILIGRPRQKLILATRHLLATGQLLPYQRCKLLQNNIDCKIQNTILSQHKNLASPGHSPSAGQLLALSALQNNIDCKIQNTISYIIADSRCKTILIAIIYNINNILQIRPLTEQESPDPAFEWGSECYFGGS